MISELNVVKASGLALLGTLLIAFVALETRALLTRLPQLRHWQRFDGIVRGMPGDASLSVEITEHGEPRTHVVACPPDSADLTGRKVRILQDPSGPDRFVLGGGWYYWRPVVNLAVLLLLASTATVLLATSTLGDDVTWNDGNWVATPSAERSIPRGSAGTVMTETSEARKAVVVWTGVMGIVAVLGVVGAIRTSGFVPTLVAVIGVGFAILAGSQWLETWSRRLHWLDAGLVDDHALGRRRVPWSAMAQIQRENVNKSAQDSYDRTPIGRRAGNRPATVHVHYILDAAGRRILGLTDRLEPRGSIERIYARIQGSTVRGSGHPTTDPRSID